jgi:hypothetical protein
LEYQVTDKCAAVIFFAKVNTNKANSSQQMDSHNLGNLPQLLLRKESITGC